MGTKKRSFRKTISIVVMAAMLITTMIPTWAFGTEMEAGAAEPTQPAAQQEATTPAGNESPAEQPQQEGQAGAGQQGATQPAASGTQPPAAQQSTSQQSDTPAVTAEHFVKVQAKNADVGFEKSNKTPYFAAAVKKADNTIIESDKLKKVDKWYQGGMNLCSEDAIGYDNGTAYYEISLQNYFKEDGSVNDGYVLDHIEIGGHKVTFSEIEKAEGNYIKIPAGNAHVR